MKYTKKELITYRIKRSEESLDEAKTLAAAKHWNALPNRLYYSCFYIVSALLIKHGFNPKIHAGTKVLFDKHFVKEGVLDISLGEFYGFLFEKRQESDYKDFFDLKKENAEELLS